jgi:two-component system OmpR family response regulator
MSTNPTVLIVEDDSAIREGLGLALEDEGYGVLTAGNGAEAVEAGQTLGPDLAVVDVGLPGHMDGLEVARRLRAEGVPVVFVTARGTIDERLAGFKAGADDYVVKPFSVSELLARIRVALRRHGHLESAIREIGLVRLDEAAHTVAVAGEAVQLTATEFEVLLMLMRHRDTVLSKTQLLAHVRGDGDFGGAVVESHVSSLRRKLGPAAQMIETVRGYGYVIR